LPGVLKDYFIIYYLETAVHQQSLLEPQSASFPTKHFYWASSTNFIFSSLPLSVASHAAHFAELRTLFSGEFDTVIVESTEAPKVIDAAHGIILPPKHLTELDRLSYVVHEIDRTCFAIPTGALKYTPLHQVIFNEAFKGLKPEAAFELSGWKHFRKSECSDQKELIARQEAFYSTDFLDPISGDMPNQVWSVQRDTTQCVAILRNQLW
jgi:hypothetical protein